MKKLTLDETWEQCLSMWRWIARQEKAGGRRHVCYLKEAWLENHGFETEDIQADCFFCHYAKSQCNRCPAGKIEKGFNCLADGVNYHRPVAFYNKLVSLNRKRLKKKGKK